MQAYFSTIMFEFVKKAFQIRSNFTSKQVLKKCLFQNRSSQNKKIADGFGMHQERIRKHDALRCSCMLKKDKKGGK